MNDINLPVQNALHSIYIVRAHASQQKQAAVVGQSFDTCMASAGPLAARGDIKFAAFPSLKILENLFSPIVYNFSRSIDHSF